MKKIIAIVMALVMMMAVAVPAFAEDLSQQPSQAGDVIISTSTIDEDGDDAESYVVTIPADTVIDWGDTDAVDVSYTVESHLGRDKGVSVVVVGSGQMKTVDGKYTLAYSLTGAVDFTADSPVIYPAATQNVYVTVAKEAWDYAVVEAYADTLTYTAEVVAI